MSQHCVKFCYLTFEIANFAENQSLWQKLNFFDSELQNNSYKKCLLM